MFNRPYQYETYHVEDHWWKAEIILPDESLLRLHIIRKEEKDNLLGLNVTQHEFNFDRGPVDTPESEHHKHIELNSMGDMFKIYSTVYDFCYTWALEHRPQVLAWGAHSERAFNIYKRLGLKYYKEWRYRLHPMKVVATAIPKGAAIVMVQEDLVKDIVGEHEKF